MEIFMLSEGDPGKGYSLLSDEPELSNNKDPNDNDWFEFLLKIIILLFLIVALVKFIHL